MICNFKIELQFIYGKNDFAAEILKNLGKYRSKNDFVELSK